MRPRPSSRRDQAHLVTEAPQSRSAEISQRQRRYLLLMGLRLVCFVLTVVMFLNHAGWFTLIPALGATVLPYFAVVIANARRPTGAAKGFRPYEPALPARFDGPRHDGPRQDGPQHASPQHGGRHDPGHPGHPGHPGAE